MVELKEYINESLYGTFIGMKNRTRLALKNLKKNGSKFIDDLKKSYDSILNKLKNQNLVISATSVSEYNQHIEELMDICANSDDRIECLKVYFEKNPDKNGGEFNVYVVYDQQDSYEDKAKIKHGDWDTIRIPFKYCSYYILTFDTENNFTRVIKGEGKDMVSTFDRKIGDLGLRLTQKLDKWLNALKDLSNIYDGMK